MVENNYSVEYHTDETEQDPLKQIKARHFHSSQITPGVTSTDYRIRYLELTDELTYKIANNNENPDAAENSFTILPLQVVMDTDIPFKNSAGETVLLGNFQSVYNGLIIKLKMYINTTPLLGLPAGEVINAVLAGDFTSHPYALPQHTLSKSRWTYDPSADLNYNAWVGVNPVDSPQRVYLKFDDDLLTTMNFQFELSWMEGQSYNPKFVEQS